MGLTQSRAFTRDLNANHLAAVGRFIKRPAAIWTMSARPGQDRSADHFSLQCQTSVSAHHHSEENGVRSVSGAYLAIWAGFLGRPLGLKVISSPWSWAVLDAHHTEPLRDYSMPSTTSPIVPCGALQCHLPPTINCSDQGDGSCLIDWQGSGPTVVSVDVDNAKTVITLITSVGTSSHVVSGTTITATAAGFGCESLAPSCTNAAATIIEMHLTLEMPGTPFGTPPKTAFGR